MENKTYTNNRFILLHGIFFIQRKHCSCTLLTQTLYLDVYQNGFDVVLRQMIDVINGVNTYRSSAETYENIKVKVKINEKEAEILFYAETYMEPISRYGIILANEEDDITWKCETDPMTLSGFNKAADGEVVNCEHNAIGNMAVAFVGTSGVQMGWLASQADMLAEDWIFAEE